MSKERPQFLIWFTIFKLQLHVLIFLRSIREANFELYINSLSSLVPWFFALSRYNYARWLPVHLRDMLTLKDDHPLTAKEFSAGKFVVTKTERKLSELALDHAHEQNNAIVKDYGIAVGLTGNPGALRRWAVAGPEMARLCNIFEDSIERIRKRVNEDFHHEQKRSVQNAFMNDVKTLTAVIEEFGSPFTEESKDLLVLDTRDIVNNDVIDTLFAIEKNGKEQYESFVQDRLIKQVKSVFDPID